MHFAESSGVCRTVTQVVVLRRDVEEVLLVSTSHYREITNFAATRLLVLQNAAKVGPILRCAGLTGKSVKLRALVSSHAGASKVAESVS